MKEKAMKLLSLLLIASLLFALCSCGRSEGGDSSESSQNQDSQTKPAQISAETAMENFVKKLTAGNYVIDIPDYVKTTVVSPEQVLFTSDNDSSSAINYAFVTLNNETFEGDLEQDALTEVGFVAPGNAIDALGFILPNDWIVQSEGNMFNLFYNNVDDPLEFTSYEDSVKITLLGLAGYGEYALSVMEEVHMRLDAEDPTSVHFTAKMGETGTMIHYQDLDLTLEFGSALSDARVENWLKDPVYPSTRTYWTSTDIDMLDIVFFRGYGEMAVPFPSFSSYAMIFDDKAYDESTIVRITDAHATEKDVEDYIAALKDRGYEEAVSTLEDGTTITVYRLMLREEYLCYAELYPHFDNGFVMEGGLYYDNPSYEGLAAISAVVEAHGFAALGDTNLFEGWSATDTAASRSEGWAYFFDYDLYMPLILTYSDFDNAKAYLEDYGNDLLNSGFISEFAPGEASEKFTSPNGFTIFSYTFLEDEDSVMLEFKKEKSLTCEEVKALLAEHGLPETDIHGEIGARDTTRYYYVISSFSGLHLLVYQPFDTAQEAEAFLDTYVAQLDEQGYLMMDPQKLGSQRQFLYFNEELAKYVAFDYFAEEDGASVNFEFVSIEPDEDVLQSSIGK